MADLTLSVTLTRNYLGLTPLEVGDAPGFECTPQFMGGTVSWTRETAGSVYIDGEVTTSRKRQMVTEPLVVDILGRTTYSGPLSIGVMRDNHDALVDAISQDSYTMTITIDGEVWQYACEASDYAMVWNGPRMMARRGQMNISVLRQPRPLVGST